VHDLRHHSIKVLVHLHAPKRKRGTVNFTKMSVM
jgi:hypothetical protein